MILYRFCSRAEADALMRGEVIRNNTDHYKGGTGGSVSRGFCLTREKPKKAWRYLKGIVTPEVCMMMDIPVNLLTVSWGKYVKEVVEVGPGEAVAVTGLKKERCISRLRPEWLRDVIELESFVPDYELEAARMLDKAKKEGRVAG